MVWCTVVAIICIVAVLTNCEHASNSDNKSAICDGKCESSTTKHHKQNRLLKLICRDDTTLVVEIENEFGETKVIEKIGESYMISINNNDVAKLPPKTVYLIKKPIVTIANLTSNTSYNISANLLNEHYQYTAEDYFMEFKTLETNYIPGNVTKIYTEDFTLNSDGNGLNVVVLWKPAADRTCFYNLLFHSKDDFNYESDTFAVREIKHPQELYRHELKDLAFGIEYAIGVRGINTKNPMLHSEIWWHVITTPSCLEWFKDNVTICAPYEPENITVAADLISENHYNFNVSWDKPPKSPDYYTIDIIEYESELRQIFNISNGTTNSVQFTNVEIRGLHFELFVTAHSVGGDSSTIYRGKLDRSITYEKPVDDYSTIEIATFIGAPLLAILIVVAVIFNINQRAKSIRAQNRDNYFRELEMKSPKDPSIYEHFSSKEQLDQIDAIRSEYNFDEDSMELDPNMIHTLEIIGEGAFGCVRRGILLSNKHVIAVKMLKSGPSLTDVRNFYREIEVMKSVPRHPNIVGIVGHCTKNLFGPMLLTEYCSEGNLLNFLRNIYDDQISPSTLAVSEEYESHQKYDPLRSQCSKANFNQTLKKDLTNRSMSTSRLSIVDIVENHGYGLDLSSSRMCIVENHGYGFDIGNNQIQNTITEMDLLSFAYQVADGMDFLSMNKVVHRDLACRNVLVMSDRLTVKISDFGLSRDIYQENLYKKSGSGMLPIKWLAIESLTHQTYTTHTDVWSFGVLLYEIVTKGAVPYPTVEAKDILKFLNGNKRMERPNGCRNDIYELMRSCWNVKPYDRPTFKIIKDELVKIMRIIEATSLSEF